MNMNRFFVYFAISLGLAGCNTSTSYRGQWSDQYGSYTGAQPSQMQYGTMDAANGPARNMAVLLPLTGDGAAAGRAVRTSVESAILQNAPQNLSVTFYDTGMDATTAINTALAGNPEVIVGPIFANDARTLRAMKSSSLPAISFTSDATAIGDGVMTMALMPTNSIEAIVQEMSRDQVSQFIILAPNTDAGQMMAGAARAAATTYDIPVAGVFFYNERDTESIKNTIARASMNNPRTAANNRAREILSDILTNEPLTPEEKASLSDQLTRLTRDETLGPLPYNAVLFLGSADDTRSLASFMRYYGVGARDARFYGTALWDGTDITRDFTMSGAKFATLPDMSAEYAIVYENMSGNMPSRLATFGYDATNLAIGMMYSNQTPAAYLLNPGGYIGIDGAVRLRPMGNSERALRIVELGGNGELRTVRNAPNDFITPIYQLEPTRISPAREMELQSAGINPLNYINIPTRLRGKYKAKTYGVTAAPATTTAKPTVVGVIASDETTTVTDPDFTPVVRETVGRTYIDAIEINE